MDYAALKTELDTGHPGTGAYDVDATIAAGQINAVNRTRNKSSLSGDQLFTATDNTEFGALTDHKRNLWVAFCGKDVDPFAAANVAFVQWIFGGGSTTVSTLNSIRTEAVSRADELGFGPVRVGDIEYARTL